MNETSGNRANLQVPAPSAAPALESSWLKLGLDVKASSSVGTRGPPVDPPEFPTFQLQHESLDVVVVGGKALRVGSKVNVGACHASELLLEHGQNCHTVAEKACGQRRRREQPARYKDHAAARRARPGRVQVSAPPIDVARGVQVLPELHLLVAQYGVEVGG